MQDQEENEQRKHPATLLWIAMAVILASVGAFMCLFGFRHVDKATLSYSDSNSVIDYQICNVENSNPLIGRCEKQEVYIASLVDTVMADYRYIVDFSAPVSGELNYQLVAVLTAYSGSSNERAVYKEKEYPLSSVNKKALKDQKTLMIEHSANIDYVEFSEIMNEFRHDQASASGTLNVELRVNGELETADLPEVVDFNSKIGMEMPLAEQDLDVKLHLASPEAIKEVSMDVEVGTPARYVIGVLGLILIVSSAVVVARTGHSYNESHSYTQYEDNVERLLDCYDSIIVSVRDMPNLRGLKINEVDDFEDLLDVYNAVHMPINFCQTDDTSVFIVINEGMAWRFTVYASDFEIADEEKAPKA